MFKNNLLRFAKVVILVVILSVGVTTAHAFTEPQGAFPAGNVAAPVNTGNALQQKTGSLVIGSAPNITAGLVILSLASNPGSIVAVNNSFTDRSYANWFCLPGTNPTGGCIDKWPTGWWEEVVPGSPDIHNKNTGKTIVEGQIQIKGGGPAAGEVLTSIDGAGLAEWRPGTSAGTLDTTKATINSIELIHVEKSDWWSEGNTNNNARLSVQCPSSHPDAIAVSCLSPANGGVDECYLAACSNASCTTQKNTVSPFITNGVPLPAWDEGVVKYPPLGTYNGGILSTEEQKDDGWAKLQLTCAKVTPVVVVTNAVLTNSGTGGSTGGSTGGGNNPSTLTFNGPINVTFANQCEAIYGGQRMRGNFSVGNATGGTAPYTYTWAISPSVNSGPNGSTSWYSYMQPGGTYSVTIRVQDSLGVSRSVSRTIIAPDCSGGGGSTGTGSLVIGDIIKSQLNCAGFVFGVAASGGTAPYTYAWSTTPASITSNQQVFRGYDDDLARDTNYTIRVQVTDAGGTTQTKTLAVRTPTCN